MIVSSALAEAMNAEPQEEDFFAKNFVKEKCLQHFSRDGSTRTVFRARGAPSTPYEGKEYIIKYIYEENESRKKFLRRQNELLTELTSKGTLPNIVSIFHHSISESPKNSRGQSELRLSILMEYCNWHSFSMPGTYNHPELRDIGRSNELFTRLVFRQIIKGYCFFFDSNIMHRDMKLDNLFLIYDQKCEILRCVLGDFDTCLIDSDGMTFVGTPKHKAPEVNGRLPYDYKADIYSMGVMLFRLILRTTADMTPQMMAQVARDYPQVFTLISAMTKDNPKERPTIADILEFPWFNEDLPDIKNFAGLEIHLPTLSELQIPFENIAHTPAPAPVSVPVPDPSLVPIPAPVSDPISDFAPAPTPVLVDIPSTPLPAPVDIPSPSPVFESSEAPSTPQVRRDPAIIFQTPPPSATKRPISATSVQPSKTPYTAVVLPQKSARTDLTPEMRQAAKGKKTTQELVDSVMEIMNHFKFSYDKISKPLWKESTVWADIFSSILLQSGTVGPILDLIMRERGVTEEDIQVWYTSGCVGLIHFRDETLRNTPSKVSSLLRGNKKEFVDFVSAHLFAVSFEKSLETSIRQFLMRSIFFLIQKNCPYIFLTLIQKHQENEKKFPLNLNNEDVLFWSKVTRIIDRSLVTHTNLASSSPLVHGVYQSLDKSMLMMWRALALLVPGADPTGSAKCSIVSKTNPFFVGISSLNVSRVYALSAMFLFDSVSGVADSVPQALSSSLALLLPNLEDLMNAGCEVTSRLCF